MTKTKTPEVRIEPLEMKHAPFIQRYASDAAVAAMITIPHPYPENGGEEFVRYDQGRREKGVAFHYAVIIEDSFVGVCGIEYDKPNDGFKGQPVLDYWIGKPFWGRGYGTAAAFAVLKRAFSELGHSVIISGCLTHNPGSRRILEKCGFQPNGTEENERGTLAYYILKKDDFNRIAQTRERNDGGE